MIITEEEIIAAARVDPRELNALIAAGQPDAIIALSRAFEEAGQTSHDAYQRGRQSHGVIASSYTNDGAPVLDAAAQDGQANRNLGNAGQDLEDTAGLLKRAVTALDGAQQTGERALSGMQAGLHDLLARWNRFVLANAASGTVTPADRQRALAEGVGIVDTAAGTIRNAIDEYDAGLRRDAAELRGRGYTEDPGNLATHLAEVPDPAAARAPGGFAETLERNKESWPPSASRPAWSRPRWRSRKSSACSGGPRPSPSTSSTRAARRPTRPGRCSTTGSPSAPCRGSRRASPRPAHTLSGARSAPRCAGCRNRGSPASPARRSSR